jgi:hypothetical protein
MVADITFDILTAGISGVTVLTIVFLQPDDNKIEKAITRCDVFI